MSYEVETFRKDLNAYFESKVRSEALLDDEARAPCKTRRVNRTKCGKG